MRKFELCNPIRMVFGSGEFDRLGELSSEFGKKPLVVIGQSHAKDSGLLERALELLTDADMDPVVFEGIEPNPRLKTCQTAARMAQENDCDMVIGIGGGSVMDASKVIAFGFYDPDDMWRRIADFHPDFERPDKALPIVLASTLAATGSEGDAGAVITNEETNEKLGVFGDCMYPKVSIIDPELTVTVPADYTIDGAVDMAIHVLESYFNGDPWATFADRATEALFIEVMIATGAVIENPEDMAARSQLSYLGAIALTGFINRPRGGNFPLHQMQHPMSACFDISHGRGLALLLPRWLKYVSREKPDKIIQFGERVFGLDLETHHPFEAADIVIERLSEWLEDIGAFFYMDDLDIPNDPATLMKMAEDCIRQYAGEKGVLTGIKDIGVDDIFAIYESCIRIGQPEVEPEPEPEEPDEEDDDEDEADEAVEPVEDAAVTEPAEEAAAPEPDSDEVVEEIIEIVEGEEMPEGVEGKDYIVVEEIVEEVVEEPKEKKE